MLAKPARQCPIDSCCVGRVSTRKLQAPCCHLPLAVLQVGGCPALLLDVLRYQSGGGTTLAILVPPFSCLASGTS
jgi:hypothetical protein